MTYYNLQSCPLLPSAYPVVLNRPERELEPEGVKRQKMIDGKKYYPPVKVRLIFRSCRSRRAAA